VADLRSVSLTTRDITSNLVVLGQTVRAHSTAYYYYYYYYYWTSIIKVSLSRKTSRTLYISQRYKKNWCSADSVQGELDKGNSVTA